MDSCSRVSHNVKDIYIAVTGVPPLYVHCSVVPPFTMQCQYSLWSLGWSSAGISCVSAAPCARLVGAHKCPEGGGQWRQVQVLRANHAGSQAGQGGVAYTVGNLEHKVVREVILRRSARQALAASYEVLSFQMLVFEYFSAFF